MTSGFSFSAQQLNRTSRSLRATEYPIWVERDGGWRTTGADAWTSGFLSGSLWLQYQRTLDPVWRDRALEWQAGVEEEKTNTGTHDLGFMFMTSFGNAYRLTGDDSHRRAGLEAAKSMASRYSPSVGAYKASFPSGTAKDFKVIMDQMVNLELLFWGARNGGPKAWRDIAVSHALKTRENHVRANGSTFHVVNYSPRTGAVRQRGTAQGYSETSTWSRGQAWAIYGFTGAYRETRDPRFLDAARRTADWYLAHLPKDRIPYWDFDVAGTAGQPRDSSAAAIAASGLLELSRREPDAERARRYGEDARKMLSSLSSKAYLARGTTAESVLLHGTANKLADQGIDRGVIWGDYYFLEALHRLRLVTALKVSAAGATRVNLSWSAATDDFGVTGYEIYRNDSLVATAPPNASSFSDTGVATGTRYEYAVRPRASGGGRTEPSNTATVTTPG